MPLETRGKKREAVQASAEYAVNEATEKSIKLNLPTDSIKSGSGEAVFVKSSLLDISVSGCAIDSAYIIPPGVILDIKIDRSPFTTALGLPAREPMRMVGRVTSCAMKAAGRYRLGIFFTEIEKEDADLIDNFIKSKDKRQTPRWNMTG
jgi:hypothetical protein